jgi:hypothetical protein
MTAGRVAEGPSLAALRRRKVDSHRPR